MHLRHLLAFSLIWALGLSSARAAEKLSYRFQKGESFRLLGFQEAFPADGPRSFQGKAVYDFQVLGDRELQVLVTGEATVNGVTEAITGLSAELSFAPRGLSLAPGREFTPGRPRAEDGTQPWAVLMATKTFFPQLPSSPKAQIQGWKSTSLVHTKKVNLPMSFSTLKVENQFRLGSLKKVAGHSLRRIDFTSQGILEDSYFWVDMRGTLRVQGYLIFDLELGRPVFLTASSNYAVKVLSTGWRANKAKARVRGTRNGGITPGHSVFVDAAFLQALSGHVGKLAPIFLEIQKKAPPQPISRVAKTSSTPGFEGLLN
jgi:hypothetical protein